MKPKRRSKPIPSFPGPSLADVNAFSDAKVLKQYKRLKIELPRRPTTFLDDYEIKADGTITDKTWTPALIAQEEAKTEASYQLQLRTHLFVACVDQWLLSLGDAECWTIIETLEGVTVSQTERRYVAPNKLRARSNWAIYAKAVHHHQPKEAL